METSYTLKTTIVNLLTESVDKLFGQKANIKVDYPQDPSHGDYASNIALLLAKELKKPPLEIAEQIAASLRNKPTFEKIEVAPPGFINFFISHEILDHELITVIEKQEKYGQISYGQNKNLIVEYSQPNIAKPLGVHHLLSTIIGQSLYDIFKAIGFNTISINHIGDWGTQFGKLIYAYKKWGDKKTIEKDPINELLKLYVHFHDEAEKDESLEDRAREEFKKFEDGDKENRELWQWFVDESMKEINKTYQKLGHIHFDYTQGESFYEDKMSDLIEEGKKLGIFTKGKEGSLIAEYDDPNMPPFVILKKDGATLYSTRDFAALHYRIQTFKPEKILYVVDVAQSLHFKQLLTAADGFPWYKNQAEHISFGRMHMKEGKMSTRKGTVILLDDVLDEATRRAKEIIEQKSPHLKDKEQVAKKVGIGAIKYNILSQNRTTDITFDWDIMLSLEGNSAPYLQYTYARARSILRKQDEAGQNTTEEDADLTTQKTTELLRKIPIFSEKILEAALQYKPNILALYLYQFAQSFNSFYNSVPILQAQENREERLKLVQASSQIIKNGLSLLGVEVVKEM